MMKPAFMALALALWTGFAAAHEPVKGPNGGMVVDAGPYHVELVGQDAQLTLFVSDGAAKPISALGFKALAILIVGGKSHRVELTPTSGDRLTGAAPTPLPRNPKGAVQLTAPDGRTAQARFN